MSKAQSLYDSIGNEIFKDIADSLRLDESVREFKRGEATGFIFNDGSTILFEGGFASVTSAESENNPASRPKQFENMSALERRLFSVGMYAVAMVLSIFTPNEIDKAVQRLINERLRNH
jgi:hypothetical protein